MAGLTDAATELEALAFRLRRAGEGDLLREVTKAMRDAVVPAQDEIRAGLKPHLPDRYAATLDADLRLGVNTRTTGSDPGVSVTGQTGKKRKLTRLDGGILEHPVFGDRRRWEKQGEPSVHPRWFTGPAEDAAPRVRAAIEKALEDISNRAAGR